MPVEGKQQKRNNWNSYSAVILSNWLANGMTEFDVMTLAGHANFETTRNFYLAVREDLLNRARVASVRSMKSISVANLLQVPSDADTEKTKQSQHLSAKVLKKRGRQDSNLRPTV